MDLQFAELIYRLPNFCFKKYRYYEDWVGNWPEAKAQKQNQIQAEPFGWPNNEKIYNSLFFEEINATTKRLVPYLLLGALEA